MEDVDDRDLIIKAIAGSDDAFTELFQRYYSFLYKYLLKLTLNEETSRDLAQETMIKCYTNLSSFKGEGKVLYLDDFDCLPPLYRFNQKKAA